MNQIAVANSSSNGVGGREANLAEKLAAIQLDIAAPFPQQPLAKFQSPYLSASINWDEGVEQWGLND